MASSFYIIYRLNDLLLYLYSLRSICSVSGGAEPVKDARNRAVWVVGPQWLVSARSVWTRWRGGWSLGPGRLSMPRRLLITDDDDGAQTPVNSRGWDSTWKLISTFPHVWRRRRHAPICRHPRLSQHPVIAVVTSTDSACCRRSRRIDTDGLGITSFSSLRCYRWRQWTLELYYFKTCVFLKLLVAACDWHNVITAYWFDWLILKHDFCQLTSRSWAVIGSG